MDDLEAWLNSWQREFLRGIQDCAGAVNEAMNGTRVNGEFFRFEEKKSRIPSRKVQESYIIMRRNLVKRCLQARNVLGWV